MKPRVFFSILGLIMITVFGGLEFVVQRQLACATIPFVPDALPAVQYDPAQPRGLPMGWLGGAPSAQAGSFSLDGDGRSMQLIGIANFIETPPVGVNPRLGYCMRVSALSDASQGARVRLRFRWFNADDKPLGEALTDWHPVALWTPQQAPKDWALIAGDAVAPDEATTLRVRIEPASDDRVYLDLPIVRRGGRATLKVTPVVTSSVTLLPWPNGSQAALSFSFDWETAMGGLVHSRSVDDPLAGGDPVVRGLRMRQGVTNTLALFASHSIRATYYGNGYNFLLGNTQRQAFLGNPIYHWASHENRWTSDSWQTTPWFTPDPFGTVRSDPAWYMGDLVPLLQHAHQDIQSHTFSHLYAGFASPDELKADGQAWNELAASTSVSPAQSLAFPWSGSGGMSDASWAVLEGLGIRSVTRTSEQSQYNLFPRDERGLIMRPGCVGVPGHTTILACADQYLTPQSGDLTIEQIRRTLATSGTLDIWAHTEEVTSPEQIAVWQRVIDFAASQPGIWIAPLREIAAWQSAREQLTIEPTDAQNGAALALHISNPSEIAMQGVLLETPFNIAWVRGNFAQTLPNAPRRIKLDLAAKTETVLQIGSKAQ